MIWLTWRQFRLQAVVIAAAVLAIGFALILTGPDLLHSYQVNKSGFLDQTRVPAWNMSLYFVGLVAVCRSAGDRRLLGSAVDRPRTGSGDAPTGVDPEHQPDALAAHQAGHLRWGGGGHHRTAQLRGDRWSDPIDDAVGSGADTNSFLPRLWPPVFGARGIVPIGYTAFAFALGIAIGLIVRRSLVAVALTLAVVIAVQILSPILLRPHLVTPATTTAIVTDDNMRGLQIQGSPIESRGERPRGPDGWTGRLEAGRPDGELRRRGPEDCCPPGSGPVCHLRRARRRRKMRTSRWRPASPGWRTRVTGRRSPTSPPAASGICSGARPASSCCSRSPWPASASGGSGAT